jgi:hypothetical protein
VEDVEEGQFRCVVTHSSHGPSMVILGDFSIRYQNYMGSFRSSVGSILHNMKRDDIEKKLATEARHPQPHLLIACLTDFFYKR